MKEKKWTNQVTHNSCLRIFMISEYSHLHVSPSRTQTFSTIWVTLAVASHWLGDCLVRGGAKITVSACSPFSALCAVSRAWYWSLLLRCLHMRGEGWYLTCNCEPVSSLCLCYFPAFPAIYWRNFATLSNAMASSSMVMGLLKNRSKTKTIPCIYR